MDKNKGQSFKRILKNIRRRIIEWIGVNMEFELVGSIEIQGKTNNLFAIAVGEIKGTMHCGIICIE